MTALGDPSTIVVTGLKKIYEGYPSPGAEAGGIFLWLALYGVDWRKGKYCTLRSGSRWTRLE